MITEIPKLQRDIAKYAISVLRVLAEASWSLGSVKLFHDRLAADAVDILARVFAKVNPQDLPHLDKGALEDAVNREVDAWTDKAKQEFPPPWLVDAPEQASTRMTGHHGLSEATKSPQGQASPQPGNHQALPDANGPAVDATASVEERNVVAAEADTGRINEQQKDGNAATAIEVLPDPEQAERAKIRSAWLDQKLAKHSAWTSDTDIAGNGGLTYNTIRRYRTGTRSTREMHVRKLLAKAFRCVLDEVPK
jgi:hypothetical protein